MGANKLCSVRRISAMLLGTTTTRLDGSVWTDAAGVNAGVRPGVADDDDKELAFASRKAPGGP